MSIGDSRDRPAAETVYLELSDGQSHKFYEVTVNGTAVTIRYGRIGTAGQSSNSTYATSEKAQAEATKKINEKLRKGYVQVSSGGNCSTSSDQVLTDSRHYWAYGSGWFTANGQGGWEEVNEETRRRGQPWWFRETTRTEEYVELYDQSRQVTVRLTTMAMLVRWDRDGTNARWEEYHKGQWQEPSRDRPAAESPAASEIIDPTILPPSLQLLNQVPVFPPHVIQNLLPNVGHQLGSSVRELCSNPAIVTPAPPSDQRPSPPQEITDIPPFLEDLPAQFEPLRSFLQQSLIPYIKIQVGEQVGDMDFFNRGTGDPLTVWQSKIGGNPYFPKTAAYPVDPDIGKAMPLLMQINCAEVPPIAGFDFPQVGILQFYLGFEPADASDTPGKYRVLYFPEISTDSDDLITDFSFIEGQGTIREIYPEVYPITFSVSRDLFWESRYGEDIDSPEELAALCDEFDDWIGDYDYEQGTGQRGSKLGGYVDFHSDTNEIAERANGRLLLELVHPSCSDDSFLFFIPDEQLRDRDFSDVEFSFVCD